MKRQSLSKTFVAAICFVCATVASGSFAQHSKALEKRSLAENRKPHGLRKPPARSPGAYYRFDNRHWHDRYYPKQGYIQARIPDRRIRLSIHDRDYYYFGGIWYRPRGLEYEVITPPIGIFSPVLPPYYTTIWVRGVPYYYANHVYYTWRARRNGYEVVEPPDGADESKTPLVADELFIYPKKDQSEDQQADDRYACHSWSRDQSSYDPTQPPSNLPLAELTRKRDDYQRAMRACLEGRDYSVR